MALMATGKRNKNRKRERNRCRQSEKVFLLVVKENNNKVRKKVDTAKIETSWSVSENRISSTNIST
jgi:hypothetical protein